MRRLTQLITPLMVTALLLVGCLAPAGGAPIEPQAGQWQTWVVTDVTSVHPPAPPDAATSQTELAALKTLATQRDDAAQAQVAYWDAGSPSYRWVQIALDQFKRKPVTNPRVARGMSLLNTAIYDALVATWDAKYTYNRPRPSQVDPTLATLVTVPNSPAYPSEHAVVAGAAAAILSYLYPDDAQTFLAQAEAAAQSRLLAGVQYPSDVAAGLALGQQVAQLVIERAQTDGSDAQWDGTMPTEPGHWTGEKPVEPLAANWQPWVLDATNELRPAAPPAYDSPEMAAELQEVQTFTRTWQSNQKALYWQTFDSIFTTWYEDASRLLFEHHLDGNPPRAAQIYAAMSVSQYDAILACWDAKYTYWAIRPAQLDPALVTLFPTPSHPSYPSSHSCDASAIAAVLEAFFPAEAAVIHAKADEAGESRLWAGIHFRSDIESGLTLGRGVSQKVIEHAVAMTEP